MAFDISLILHKGYGNHNCEFWYYWIFAHENEKKTAINRTVGSASDSISVGSMAVVPGTLFIDYIVGTYPFDGSTLAWHTM